MSDYAKGWISLYNSQPHPVSLIFEPWGVGPNVPIPPGETFVVWLEPLESEMLTIQFWPDGISIYADLWNAVIWHNGKCIDYYGDKNTPPPKPPER